ncbi:uncharacterized protein LACBIDRAFT_328214 [Laccaria bicolor S238N-H82]|uniref:Predicted protein n=1 Tax=Laccaria bicolor (strain S238N-H82 / ATCC MYA-4686) TaxID=486041 RepID=B0DE37_LACBS|nr:uncharacterized protein LACBIDRAFT_328214 [Laccaria bicolor S238N-H82]EDR07198.1 predicted protein [Laccaria bicolor S238N-H82]|eukprot:XP_001882129.1 predicted protein [Laccaria bicolor S238N-H82]
MGPPPPPQPQEIAVAITNHLLDHQDNIDPQLLMHEIGLTDRVVVRIPVNDKFTKDIDIPVDIPYNDFVSRVCASMNLNPATAELGWKSIDDAKRDPARQLTTENDLQDAFHVLVKAKKNTRREKEVAMQMVHLNPVAPKPAKKKTDGNKATDFAYGEELCIMKGKLKCEQHNGPNRWCYVSSNDPADHVKLGLEEVTLWARKLKDDLTLDRACVLPPNCLSLDKLRERATKHANNKTATNTALGPAVHVHNHFTNPVDPAGLPTPSRRSKRARSSTPDSSDDSMDIESLPLTEVLADLNTKYPKLHFDQYEAILEKHGIVYAESVDWGWLRVLSGLS